MLMSPNHFNESQILIPESMWKLCPIRLKGGLGGVGGGSREEEGGEGVVLKSDDREKMEPKNLSKKRKL